MMTIIRFISDYVSPSRQDGTAAKTRLFYTVFELSGSQVLLRALREFLEGNTQAFVKGTAFVLVDCSALK